MKRYFLLPLLILLLGGQAIQANDRLTFRTFDVKSGISDNFVQSIIRDQYGFMWFATLNKLNRYDGYQFKQYTTTQLGSYNNDIEQIMEDASGTIWIKTPLSYYCYNREQDEIDNKIRPILNQWGIDGEISNLFVDEDQNLWCVADDRLYYYNFSQKELFTFSLPDKGKVLQLACRKSVAYLLFSNGNVSTIDWKSRTIRKETKINLLPGLMHRMYIDTFARLWFYAAHSSGIHCYDTHSRSRVSFAGQDELKNDFITAFMDDGSGNIWIGTDNKGIYIINNRNDHFTRLYKEADNLFSLPNNHINCFFKDKLNIMWVGTSKQGVTFTCLKNTSFETCHLPKQEDVSCMLEDSNSNLWIGFDGEGVTCFNSKSGRYTLYKTKGSDIPSDLIVCSYLDSKNRVWFGSYGKGAFYEQNGKFISLPYPATSGKEDPTRYIRRITEDGSGNIWLGTIMQGLYCYDKNGQFTSYAMGNSILLTNSITDLSCVDKRTLYIGTSSGLHRMDTETREIVQFKGNRSGTQRLDDEYINCLFQDSRGLLWIGGRSGIRIYNPKNDMIEHLSTENGISHPYVRAIIEDKDKNLWVTTDHGITNIVVTNDPSTHTLQYRCYPYFEEDGIGNMTFNNHSIICNNRGEILMGGTGGYLKINPKSNDFYHYCHHQVIFTGLHLANQRMDVGTKTPDGRILLKKNIQLLNEITMDYSDSNFALEISAMDYGSQHKLRYAYRLDNKEEWVKLEGNRIYFNKLSPGTYQLQVKVNEPHNDGHNNISTLTIHVCPPFWLSIPAYICYTILLILGLFALSAQIRRKHQRILLQQKHEMEIAQQHEMDEAKMRFFTNISHDLRTPLSLIIIPLEKLLASPAVQAVKEDLEVMHRNATTLLNEVNQLLDFRRLDQHKVQLSVSYGNVTEFIREICSPFQSLASSKGIKLQLEINTPNIGMNFDRDKMQRIMLNLLSNAIKYNRENGSVTVKVDTVQTDDNEQICIRIADTGIGVKDENKEKIFERFFQEQHCATTYVGSGIGLHIVKEYVTLHGGTIEVKDNVPQGSVFIVSLPVNRDKTETQTETEMHTKAESPIEELPTTDNGKEKNKILIVEDNDDFRRFLINCLKNHYQVFDAPNGQKALDMLSRQPVQIVISDVMMPVMDGMELCRNIKTDIRYSHIPIILLTARTAEEHILSGLKEGADDYITKPFNLEILLLRIQKLLKWTENNHEKFKTIDISPSEITVSTLDEQLIEKAIQAVEENMDNSEFSVEELGNYVGMSRGHLYKKLTLITGKSPIEFIRILRIKRGRQLLEQGQTSISQVAYQIGLSPKQFAKYFKEEFGCLPSEYEKHSTN